MYLKLKKEGYWYGSVTMSEETHPSPEEYDAKIRGTIPRYDALLSDAQIGRAHV